MEVAVLGVLVGMAAVIGIFVMIIYLRRYTNQERMALIEKGVSAELFFSKTKPKAISVALRASLLLMGAGFGVLIAYFLDYKFHMEHVAYFSMLLIFGGIGLGLAYIIEERKEKQG